MKTLFEKFSVVKENTLKLEGIQNFTAPGSLEGCDGGIFMIASW